jgi:hypothetical protein
MNPGRKVKVLEGKQSVGSGRAICFAGELRNRTLAVRDVVGLRRATLFFSHAP